MVKGASQMNRYFTSAAVAPAVAIGYTSTFCPLRVCSSKRTTIPPPIPELDPLDQMIFGSTGSGVAHPLSPPPTPCQSLRWMPSAPRLLLGPRYDPPSCLFP